MNLLSFCKWNEEKPAAEEGVLVACDLAQEWLLPWWWNCYRKTNDHPVAFVDLGLSESMKKWCRERGTFIRLKVPDVFVSEKDEIEAGVASAWEDASGRQFWENRNAWFKKPMACLQTPFQKTIWLDLDCEVLGSLLPLFAYCGHASGIAIAREQNDPFRTEGSVNSGVIVYRKGLPLFEMWAREALENNHRYPGDQDILTVLIRDFAPLPEIYNWSRCRQDDPSAVIIHWHGKHGKTVIRHKIGKEYD